ncbi:MAG: hypothetical protein ABJ215_00455 [Alphaproteobacteria bacterium]
MIITKPLHAVAVAVFAFAVLVGPAGAADLPNPGETVILTIGGAVTRSNRGAPDHFAASFLKTQEYDYTKAAAFDVPMLERLGMVKTTIKAAPWPRAITLEGPRLVDVLMAAGWNGTKITMVALDGFAVEISAADIAAREWIVGIKADGAYLPIGGRGPVWIVYQVPGGQGTEEDEARWPWAVFYISAE